jgi:hypothetical protein
MVHRQWAREMLGINNLEEGGMMVKVQAIPGAIAGVPLAQEEKVLGFRAVRKSARHDNN